MEREGQYHPLEEMLTEEEQEHSEHEVVHLPAQQEKSLLSTAEKIVIARNPEAKKALLEWRRVHKIIEAKHGPLSTEHATMFFAWAHDNQKIDFSQDPKLEKLYNHYVGQEKIKQQERVLDRARKRHEEETDELPSIMIDEEYAQEIAPAHAYEINTRTLVNILKNKKVERAYKTWTETTQDPNTLKDRDSKDVAAEFINWATEHTDIDFSKLIKEKKTTQTETVTPTPEQKIALAIRTDKYLQPLVAEWGKLHGEKNKSFKTISTTEDIIDFAEWAQTEKALDIPGETYAKLDKLRYDLENGKSTSTSEEPSVIVDPELLKESEEIDEARRRVNTIPETPISTDTDKIDTEITSYQRKIFDTYGIRLTETGEPARPQDESKIRNMLGLIDPDVRKIQRSGFFGKIKGFFQDIGTSENERMMARAFKKDLSGLTQLILSQPPKYGDRMPVGRSVVRESHTDHIQRGSTTYTRHTPLRRPAPKRPRKPRTTKSQS